MSEFINMWSPSYQVFDTVPIYRELYHKFDLVTITQDLFWIPRRIAERIELWR